MRSEKLNAVVSKKARHRETHHKRISSIAALPDNLYSLMRKVFLGSCYDFKFKSSYVDCLFPRSQDQFVDIWKTLALTSIFMLNRMTFERRNMCGHPAFSILIAF